MQLIHNVGGGGLEYGIFDSPFIRNGGDDGQGGPQISRRAMFTGLVENNTLREDQTREIDETMLRVARRMLTGISDLARFGLTVPLAKGVGATTYEYDKITPVGQAKQGMSILDLGDDDLVNITRTAIPVPVTASQFKLDARQLAAGRGMGDSIDMVNIEEHTRAVAEKLEDTLCNGSSVVLGGNGISGYTNLTGRDTGSFSSGHWNDQTAGVHSAAIADVVQMRADLRANGFTGPYILYVPSNFDGVLEDDFKANSGLTLRQRLIAMDGIEDIKVLPPLAADNVLLVQMSRSVVTHAIGQNLTTVTWSTHGGLATRWAILHVGVPALRVANARAALASGTLPSLTTAAGISHLS